MKSLISAIFILLWTASGLAQVSPLIKCLALEEQYYHQTKIQDSFYRLNQKMLLALSQFPNLKARESVLSSVCEMTQGKHASVLLLEDFIINPQSIFVRPSNEEQAALLDNTLQEVKDKLPELLIAFLADLQSTLGTANCLEREVPEISYFSDRFKYLQGVISFDQLFDKKQKIESLFKGLKNWSRIVKACEKKPTNNNQ